MISKMSKKPTNRIEQEERKENTEFRLRALGVISACQYVVWLLITLLGLYLAWKTL